MKHAYVFPGQGSQFPGMGHGLYASHRDLFEEANHILGFRLSDVMFTGTEADLKQTKVTQPAIFLHSVAVYRSLPDPRPDMVAGHSLGEYSALVVAGTLSFPDALRLVSARAQAMQRACEKTPSTMAAVLGLEDEKVVMVCAEVAKETGEVVVAANYNCPGQLVISGTLKGIEVACERLKAAGAKRALPLPVGGAFHSPLMEGAREELEAAIEVTPFAEPACPVYQNTVARAVTQASDIRRNLIEQLTAPVRWTQSVVSMSAAGAMHFTEVGPGKVLQGLVGKIVKGVTTDGFA